VTKPKSLSSSGIPGILSNLQTEWDSVVLETYELRKHLENVRKQLAHALYQHDAACRVISRLIQERDEARQALAMTQQKLADYKDKFGVEDFKAHESYPLQKFREDESQIEQENCGIYPELQGRMTSLNKSLFNSRKERKKPENYYKPTDFNLLTLRGSYPLHSSASPGILSIAIHNPQYNYICTGGKDGVAVIYDSNTNKITTTLNNPNDGDKVISVEFTHEGVLLTRSNGVAEYWKVDLLAQTSQLKTTVRGHAGIKACAHPLSPYFIFGATHDSWGIYNMETGLKLCQTELDDGSELTSLTVHPDGLMMATGASNGVIKLWDIRQQNAVATLEGHKAPVTGLQFSEKAVHLASASSKENSALLWSLKKLKNPPQNIAHGKEGTIRSVTFDPFGEYITSACDKNVCFFKTSNPETCLFELEIHEDLINDIKYAMDGSYIATVSEDRFMRILAL
jgi:pre-mRNA-processing factor 19